MHDLVKRHRSISINCANCRIRPFSLIFEDCLCQLRKRAIQKDLAVGPPCMGCWLVILYFERRPRDDNDKPDPRRRGDSASSGGPGWQFCILNRTQAYLFGSCSKHKITSQAPMQAGNFLARSLSDLLYSMSLISLPVKA